MSIHRRFILPFGLLAWMVGMGTHAVRGQNAPPSSQFGVGIYTVSNYLPAAFEVTYALDSTMQVGSELYLSLSQSVGSYLVAPYIRYLPLPLIVSPFAQVGVQLYSPGTGTQLGFFLGAGVAYCINHHLNIHGDADIINFFFSPGTVSWFVLRIGADWFF